MQRDLEPLLQKYPRNLDNYLDDIWIVTKKSQDQKRLHKQITHELLDLLKEKSYFLKKSKCQFEQEEMDLLGWKVGNGEVRIDPDKVAGLREWPRTLKNVKEVRRTLGLLGYQRPLIRGFAQLARLLTELTKKDQPFEWKEEHTEALNKLIQIVTSEPVLKCPEPEKQFELEVDASAFAIGAYIVPKR
jgi:hypothetical protein